MEFVRRLYDISQSEPIPVWAQAANVRKLRLKTKSRLLKPLFISEWDARLTAPRRHTRKKITFGQVEVHRGKCPPITEPISDKIGREIVSAKIFEKYICNLWMYVPVDAWHVNVCGTHESLQNTIMFEYFNLEDIAADLRRIIYYHRRRRPAVLGYRSSWKFPAHWDERKFNNRSQRFEPTGKKKLLLPYIRRYLIKVVKDPISASIAIQAAWRRHKVLHKIAKFPTASGQAAQLTGGSRKVIERCPDCTRPMSDGKCAKC